MMGTRPLASVSLDADNLWSYKRTHGDPDWERYESYLPALQRRMIDLFTDHRIRPSVMVVGADAAAPDGVEFIGTLADFGCEIGNHSYLHEPWLHRYRPQQLRDELSRTAEAIVAAGAPQPRGFRAPGFSTSADLIAALGEQGYAYDGSVLATWIGPAARLYYLRSNPDLTAAEREERKALFGAMSDVLLPNRPFRWRGRDRGALTEIPVTVFPLARVPMHASYVIYLSGFSVPLARAYVRAALLACTLTRTEPSLLLHPLDLLDAEDAPGLGFFPGMGIAYDRKRAILDFLLAELAARFRLVSMAEHAAAIARRPIRSRPVELLRRGRE